MAAVCELRAQRHTAGTVWLALAGIGFAGLLAYVAMAVPVVANRPPRGVLMFCPLSAPPVPRAFAVRHASAALIAALAVLAADALLLLALARRRTRTPATRGDPAAPAAGGWRALARPLGLQRVAPKVVAAAATGSVVLAIVGAASGYPPWLVVSMFIGPLLPLALTEVSAKLERYGLYAFFVVVAALQVGHMGEHTVQVAQLVATHGKLGRSHGVFGMLDFETVHFFWDSAIWLSVFVLLYRFGRGNRWLWVAFAAASLHEVEHLYLYWLYNFHPAYYLRGGFEGIMGNGGVIGSPLARPYLHFAFNFLVTVPMVLALWSETKRVGRKELAGLLTHSS